MTIQKNLLFKNEPLKIIAVIALTSLTLSLLSCLLATSGINALPSRGGGGQLGAGSLSGIQPNSGGGIDRGSLQVGDPMSGMHPNGDPLSGLNRPANCGNLPTSTNCAGPIVLHPTHAPNTTVIQPANCNAPNAVRHTSAPSTRVVHPTNYSPPASVSSNSLTINNVQGSKSTTTPEQSTNAGIFDYLSAESSQNNIIPVANAGAPVLAVSNYNAANPIFIVLIVAYPTTLTFQLVVNNGQASSTPSYVYEG